MMAKAVSVPKLRVLVTNDDGIDAEGLGALLEALEATGELDVWCVAPLQQRSACSHGMTLDRPIFAERRSPRRFATSGLTADCVYFGMFGCMPAKPDVVVSGINRGPNLGTDVIYSGTVAGAREAAVRGVHGIAISLVDGDDFEPVARHAAPLAVELASSGSERPVVLNLNYPAGGFDEMRTGSLGRRRYPLTVEERLSPGRGDRYYWLGGPPVEDERVEGSDGWLISKGIASATFLSTDQGIALATEERTLLERLGIEES